jgi:hypothetical protein
MDRFFFFNSKSYALLFVMYACFDMKRKTEEMPRAKGTNAVQSYCVGAFCGGLHTASSAFASEAE